MTTINRFLLFILMPLIALFSYPVNYISQGWTVISVMAIFIVVLGVFIWRRSQNALTFSIFLHGMNVIIRLMMLLSTVVNKQGNVNVSFAITGLLGLLLSFFIMLRLDKTDVRKYVETGLSISSKKVV